MTSTYLSLATVFMLNYPSTTDRPLIMSKCLQLRRNMKRVNRITIKFVIGSASCMILCFLNLKIQNFRDIKTFIYYNVSQKKFYSICNLLKVQNNYVYHKALHINMNV